MSRFLDESYRTLTPYTPGEQPKAVDLVKLNTNESPFPPSPKAIEIAKEELKKLNLYPDPECSALKKKIAETVGNGITEENVFIGNGSDEVLYLLFNAYKGAGFTFPDISYGFYPVYARISGAEYKEVPLKDDYSVDVDGLIEQKGNIVLANPNAPTGMTVSTEQIKKMLESNRERVVVIDEAYVDFGGESVVSLVNKYDNLLVVQTFSKSRSLAGGRLGFGVASKDIIKDLELLKYSVNPYNVNRITLALGVGILEDEEYTKKNCREVMANRLFTQSELGKLDFEVLPSKANFLFARHKQLSGEKVYSSLKKKGVLVRYFDKDRLRDFVRISIGSRVQMEKLISEIKLLTEEK